MKQLTANVFLGLGSNVASRQHFLARAVAALRGGNSMHLKKISSIYESEPYGVHQQPNFLNMVVEIATNLEPIALLEQVKAIENQVGRKPTYRWGPREIDIDILCYGQVQMKTAELTIPHPELTRRRFVLLPFAEIAPQFVLPGISQSVEQLLAICPDDGWVRLFSKSVT